MIKVISSNGHTVLGVDVNEVLVAVADPTAWDTRDRKNSKVLEFRLCVTMKNGQSQYVTLTAEALEKFMTALETR